MIKERKGKDSILLYEKMKSDFHLNPHRIFKNDRRKIYRQDSIYGS
jgi:hypothetical protein